MMTRLGSFTNARRRAAEVERACANPLPKLSMAYERAALIKRSQLSSTNEVVLNFPPLVIHLHGP